MKISSLTSPSNTNTKLETSELTEQTRHEMQIKTKIRLEPRSETVIPVSTKEPEGTEWIIHSQTSQNPSVQIENIVKYSWSWENLSIVNALEEAVELSLRI